jgi:hypothetical protein
LDSPFNFIYCRPLSFPLYRHVVIQVALYHAVPVIQHFVTVFVDLLVHFVIAIHRIIKIIHRLIKLVNISLRPFRSRLTIKGFLQFIEVVFL